MSLAVLLAITLAVTSVAAAEGDGTKGIQAELGSLPTITQLRAKPSNYSEEEAEHQGGYSTLW